MQSVFKRYLISFFTLPSFIFSAQSLAGGFQLWEQNAAGIGDYHSGAAAEADTAATAFYNPAGVIRLKHQQISFGAAVIPLNISYTGSAGSKTVLNAPGNTFNIVPNFQYAIPFAQRWAFAFGVTTPFGLSTDYPDVKYVNTLATETKLKTINLNPSMAYALNKYLSLALGFDVMYGSADYDSDVFSPLTSDLSGWNCGYNAGLLLQFSSRTRLGLSYRSAITIVAKGSSDSTVFGAAPIYSTASASFPLPATSIASLYHDVNSKLTLMGSVFYTQWSTFRQLIINNLSTPSGVGTVALNENYRDTWNVGLGGKYKIDRYVSLEAGVGHDQTPTRIGYRDIRLPDNNRYAASFGINVMPKPGLELNAGVTHFFVPNTAINNANANTPQTTTAAPTIGIGTVTGNINVYGMQVSWDI